MSPNPQPERLPAPEPDARSLATILMVKSFDVREPNPGDLYTLMQRCQWVRDRAGLFREFPRAPEVSARLDTHRQFLREALAELIPLAQSVLASLPEEADAA